MAPNMGRFYNSFNIFQIDRANGRASLACKDLLLLANGRAQAKRKCPVVQTLVPGILEIGAGLKFNPKHTEL